MDFANYWFQAPAGGGGYQIGNSLRFRGAQELSRTPATASSNRKQFTISFWAKWGDLNSSAQIEHIFQGGGAAGTWNIVRYSQNYTVAARNAGLYNASLSGDLYTPNYKLRDFSAWYHIVYSCDYNQGNAADRVKIYVNGVQAPTAAGGSGFPGNVDQPWNSNVIHKIAGHTYTTGYHFSGYMAEVQNIDGQALPPTDLGEFNADGVWVPKKYTGTYGPNGWYLDFSDPADIGADRSGNGNNWTPTGFELTDTSSKSYDWMADGPTTNWCTLNPLKSTSASITNTNLDFSNGVVDQHLSVGTIGVTSGKWYWETTKTGGSNGSTGIAQDSINTNRYVGQTTDSWGYLFGGEKSHNAAHSAYGSAYTSNDVIGVAFDADAGSLYFYKNGVAQDSGTAAFTGLTSGPYFPAVGAYDSQFTVNFGQRAFAHTPPTGFDPLSTAELPAVAVTNPSEHFQTILDTGANILANAQATFPNGLWWIKDRVGTNQHQLVDSVRGGNLATFSNNGWVEAAYATPAGNSVAWCWNAGGAPVTNNDGTIAAQVSANTTAGFSIVTYTGNGNASATVGHGLGVTPAMVIVRNRSWGSSEPVVAHKSLGSRNLILSQTIASINPATDSTNGGLAALNNSSTFGFIKETSVDNCNKNGIKFVAYCWAEVPGYSSFGSYVGNGNADGPFVYTGFSPRWLLVKNSSSAVNWQLRDSSRDAYNPSQHSITANTTDSDSPQSGQQIDFCSNGFKVRNSTSDWNSNGQTYIYMAFAEHPFGAANVSPTLAR